MQTHRTDYQAVNTVGTVVYTSNDELTARRWVKRHVALHDGLRLARVTVTVETVTVYTPRAKATPSIARAA